jgi:aminomethyltransferase
MVEFAGYSMPIKYFGIIEEHLHCRENASLFDVSHMGQIRIYGKDRLDFIESLCVGDIKELKIGSAALSLFTNDQGGINDDTIITNLNDCM